MLSLTEALTRANVWLESCLDIDNLTERKVTVRDDKNDVMIEVRNKDGFPVYWFNPTYYGITERAWDEQPDEQTRKNTTWSAWPDYGQGIDVYAKRKKGR